MLEICALASGSNGNCYYIGNGSDAVLIDAGISRRQVLERMKERGLDPGRIRAILISHEHADHFRGVRRSEEHTSELQSRPHLVCRLLLEKKARSRAARLC